MRPKTRLCGCVTTLHAIDSSLTWGAVTAAQYDSNKTSIHDRMVIIPLVLDCDYDHTRCCYFVQSSHRSSCLLSTVLSFAATLGIAAVLFNRRLGIPGADPSVVLYGFVFLVALGYRLQYLPDDPGA